MTRPEALEIIMLLSALENWSFSTGKPLPNYLLDRLRNAMGTLREEILHD